MTYIVIDVQNDFLSGENVKKADKIAEFLRENVKENDLIIVTQDIHLKNDPEFEKFGEHCIKESYGWRIYPKVKEVLDSFPQKQVIYIQKNSFGRRWNDLKYLTIESALCNEMSIDEVTIMGFCTEICVLSNALNIMSDNRCRIKVNVIEELCGGYNNNEDNHNKAIDIMRNVGVNII